MGGSRRQPDSPCKIAVATWNTRKLAAGMRAAAFDSIRRGLMQEFILLVQEVPRWGKFKSTIARYGHLFYKPRSCDCGIFVPSRLMHEIKHHGSGRYWVGLLVGGMCCISVHLRTGVTRELRGRARLLKQVDQFITVCRARHDVSCILFGVTSTPNCPAR